MYGAMMWEEWLKETIHKARTEKRVFTPDAREYTFRDVAQSRRLPKAEVQGALGFLGDVKQRNLLEASL